jgi:hypothetical protein
MKVRIYLIFVFSFLLVLAGCLSGPLPEDISTSPPPVTTAPPSTDELAYIDIGTISIPPQDPEFTVLTPEIEGFVPVPYVNPVDVLSNDLSVLNHPERLQILSQIISKYTLLYIKPQRETDTLIYFTIYKLNDSTTAHSILDSYKGAWNKRPFNISENQIWIWDGYFDEMAGRVSPLQKDSILYWNPEAGGSFLSDKVLREHPALVRTKSTLYSMHGEAALGRYFFMIDIKTELEDIQNVTTQIFYQAGEVLFGNTTLLPEKTSPPINQTAETTVNKSIQIEANKIKEDLRILLEGYLAGNISKTEYETLFEKYTEELMNMTN